MILHKYYNYINVIFSQEGFIKILLLNTRKDKKKSHRIRIAHKGKAHRLREELKGGRGSSGADNPTLDGVYRSAGREGKLHRDDIADPKLDQLVAGLEFSGSSSTEDLGV